MKDNAQQPFSGALYSCFPMKAAATIFNEIVFVHVDSWSNHIVIREKENIERKAFYRHIENMANV
jgi:hypothetical protein